MNSKADLLKKSQNSFIVVNIKHQNTKTDSICSAELCGKKTGQKMTIFHLCGLVQIVVVVDG
jgi:hypothetical protein